MNCYKNLELYGRFLLKHMYGYAIISVMAFLYAHGHPSTNC